MTTTARTKYRSAFGWFLCLLLAGALLAGRFDTPGRVIAALDHLSVTCGGVAESLVLASDVAPADASPCDSSSDGSSSGDDVTDSSDCSADLEPFEELAIFGLRIALNPPRLFDLSLHYFGRLPSNFSSPEPRPAERV